MMTGYDSWLDAEYDEYCRDRDLAERDFLKEEIEELEKNCRESWSIIQFYSEELGKAMDLDDDEYCRECEDIIAYEQDMLRGYEAEIAKREEELLYLPA